MKFVKFIALAFIVAFLSACGATLNEAPEVFVGSAELEVQITSSEGDFVPIKHLEIRNSQGKVIFNETDLINRINRFSLEVGETYTVEAQMEREFGRTADYGKVTYVRQVQMLSPHQKIALDMRQIVVLREDIYASTDEDLVLTLGFPFEVYGLELVGGTFKGGWTIMVDVEGIPLYNSGIRTEVSWRHETGGEDLVVFVPGADFNPRATMPLGFYRIALDNSPDLCRLAPAELGGAEFVWENEFSQITHSINLKKSCKG